MSFLALLGPGVRWTYSEKINFRHKNGIYLFFTNNGFVGVRPVLHEKKTPKKNRKKNRFSVLTTNLKFLLITREKKAKNVFFLAKNIVFFSSKNVFMSFYPKPKMILLAYFCPILHGKKSFCPILSQSVLLLLFFY